VGDGKKKEKKEKEERCTWVEEKKKKKREGISYGCIEGGKRKMRNDGILGVMKK
jgi:hypothetical protein